MDKQINKVFLVIAALVLLTIAVNAAKVTINTANGPMTIEGDESMLMKVLSFFSSGITGMAIANPSDCPAGIVSYWDFEETSGTVANDSYDANPGTIFGATINQPGKVGQAYSFDGINDYVSLPDIDLGNQRSYTVWFKRANLTSAHRVLIAKDRAGIASEFDFALSGTALRVTIRNGTSGPFADFLGGSVTDNTTWHLGAWTYDGTNVRIYLDGALLGTWPFTQGITNNDYTYAIGVRNFYGPTNADSPFSGLIDEWYS